MKLNFFEVLFMLKQSTKKFVVAIKRARHMALLLFVKE